MSCCSALCSTLPLHILNWRCHSLFCTGNEDQSYWNGCLKDCFCLHKFHIWKADMLLLEWNPGWAGQGSLGCALLSPGCSVTLSCRQTLLQLSQSATGNAGTSAITVWASFYKKALQVNRWRRCVNFLFSKITVFGCYWSWSCSSRAWIFSLLKNFFLPGWLAKWLKYLHKYFQAQTSSKVYFRLRSFNFCAHFRILPCYFSPWAFIQLSGNVQGKTLCLLIVWRIHFQVKSLIKCQVWAKQTSSPLRANHATRASTIGVHISEHNIYWTGSKLCFLAKADYQHFRKNI